MEQCFSLVRRSGSLEVATRERVRLGEHLHDVAHDVVARREFLEILVLDEVVDRTIYETPRLQILELHVRVPVFQLSQLTSGDGPTVSGRRPGRDSLTARGQAFNGAARQREIRASTEDDGSLEPLLRDACR